MPARMYWTIIRNVGWGWQCTPVISRGWGRRVGSLRPRWLHKKFCLKTCKWICNKISKNISERVGSQCWAYNSFCLQNLKSKFKLTKKYPCGYWEPNPGSLQEQQEILPMCASLQLLKLWIKIIIQYTDFSHDKTHGKFSVKFYPLLKLLQGTSDHSVLINTYVGSHLQIDPNMNFKGKKATFGR